MKSSKSVYSLLNTDLKRGCVIPPLVLALTESGIIDEKTTSDKMQEYISANPQNLVILDGLQRTYTLIAAKEELEKENDSKALSNFLNQKLRLEIDTGINKFGILYRWHSVSHGD